MIVNILLNIYLHLLTFKTPTTQLFKSFFNFLNSSNSFFFYFFFILIHSSYVINFVINGGISPLYNSILCIILLNIILQSDKFLPFVCNFPLIIFIVIYDTTLHPIWYVTFFYFNTNFFSIYIITFNIIFI